MKTRLGIVVVCVLLVSRSSGAADAPGAAAPEMQKMHWMVGSWSVAETHEKSPWSGGGKGQGTSVVTLGPGGHSLYFDYKSSGPMGAYAGRGLTAWDPSARTFRSVWTDNHTPGVVFTACRDEGKDFVCSGDTEMNGHKVTLRSRAIDPKPSGWTEVMESSADGQSFQKMITFEYRKKG